MIWQPIETAPLGKYILIWGGCWRHPFVGRYFGDGIWVMIDSADATETRITAHSWMPLPEPP